jgi:hypothetical protein
MIHLFFVFIGDKDTAIFRKCNNLTEKVSMSDVFRFKVGCFLLNNNKLRCFYDTEIIAFILRSYVCFQQNLHLLCLFLS